MIYTEQERKEALQILELYKGWNNGQKSVSHAFGGPKTMEDEVYDARRKLILKASNILNGSS